jgi:hypothetical protein
MTCNDPREARNERKDLRKFGLTVGIAFGVLGVLLFWRGRPIWPYLVGVGGALVLVGLVAPRALGPVRRVWMGLARILGWFMTRVILSVLFFVAFTSIGLLARLFGKRFLSSGGPGTQETYWRRRDVVETDRSRYERQF